MKKILFMLPLVALSFASCEKDNGEELSGDDIIQFEDPNFLKALLTVKEIYIYVAEQIDGIDYVVDVDTNKDGQISVNEAQKVRGLKLYDYSGEDIIGLNISSMSEIKYFTALEYLDCSGNQLTSLDVSGCPALTSLYCWGNQLTSLDVSKNTALTYLDCGNNQLTSLDLSKNTALTGLWCYGNQLTSLDLSKNTALEDLNCENNQLASLDVSNNNALRFFVCYNNQLTSLDISKVSLQEFYCSGNPLTKIIINEKNSSDYYLRSIIEEYGEDIIEYVE